MYTRTIECTSGIGVKNSKLCNEYICMLSNEYICMLSNEYIYMLNNEYIYKVIKISNYAT